MSLTQIDQAPDASVSFVVLCRPLKNATLDQMRSTLSLGTVRDLSPTAATREEVIRALRDRGFTVYDKDPSPVVSASGKASEFEKLFQTRVQRYRQDYETGGRQFHEDFSCVDPAARPPNEQAIPNAIGVIGMHRPSPCQNTAIPPADSDFHLRHPTDIAIATRASLVHREVVREGQRATGEGVRVAMIDRGFFMHPFFKRNGYRLEIESAADAAAAVGEDPDGHGTRNVVGIFSCAPDAEVFGIQMGGNPILSFDRAAALPAQVIVCSWAFNLSAESALDPKNLALRLVLLNLVRDGITLVFAGGNHQEFGFPAMMPEVIAVGGVAVDTSERLEAYAHASSFVSPIFPDRPVPDLCGIASRMALPTSPESGDGQIWDFADGMTSNAAPQVAGVIALLLQKDPSLDPERVKAILCRSARDVRTGTTETEEPATRGRDRATGAGLVNAHAAWTSVRMR